uniref:Capsid protein n=1 Tax=Alhagi bacilliform virus TaxID=1973099 RepID=A0A2D0WLD1_9VIRU|nr:hypothetical protein [Alhagi bacilliform virus]
MIKIALTHRRNAGVLAMVVFRDTQMRGSLGILGQMEVDFTSGAQLIYVTPDIMMSIHDFYNHFQVAVLTRGYQDWTGGESNLFITRGIVARITNTSYTGFRHNVQGVIEYLTSRGISAISAQTRSVSPLRSAIWTVRESQLESSAQAPSSIQTRDNTDGSTSVRFGNYADILAILEEEDEDVSQPRRHTVLALINEDPKIWDTLGEPSGKFDYLVKYTAPESSKIPIEAIEPSGWGDEFNDPEPYYAVTCTEEIEDNWAKSYSLGFTRRNRVPRSKGTTATSNF